MKIDSTTKMSTTTKILLFLVSTATLIIVSVIFFLPNPETIISDHRYICRDASNPVACQDFVSEVASGGQPTSDLLKKILIKQVHGMTAAVLEATKLKNQINGRAGIGAVSDCLELLDQSRDLVVDSIDSLENDFGNSADVRAWLSGVLTNHVTCFDGIQSSGLRIEFLATIDELISRASASLAVVAQIPLRDGELIQLLRGKLPSWITAADRKLMESSAGEVKVDVTVAKDNSGDYTKVADAIAAAPDKSKKRYVIHVKKGTYKENIEVGKSKKNVMIIGDGADSTVITGDLNFADGTSTFKSATLAAVGEGFMLQDIRIQNTAGPEKHQAVALRVGADLSVMNRCRFEAFQDTLYAHSLRQFYRDCNVTGTVDFIFGNAAVVFQKCRLVPRKPMKGQKNMVTAQGRTDLNQNTGTSIQDCEIVASSDLEPVKGQFPTYLGRPWKNFSRTVVMESNIGDVIDPAGWAEWNGSFALKTLYYGEYKNRGAGAPTTKRVKWPGYHVIHNAAEAMKFTVKELIQGDQWLGSTGVAFTAGLIS